MTNDKIVKNKIAIIFDFKEVGASSKIYLTIVISKYNLEKLQQINKKCLFVFKAM